jgi:hypothetical protein
MIFLPLKAHPGDPVHGMAGERADPETTEQIKKKPGNRTNKVLLFDSGTIRYEELVCQWEIGRKWGYADPRIVGRINRDDNWLEKFS